MHALRKGINKKLNERKIVTVTFDETKPAKETLAKLGPLFTELVKLVSEYRKENKGYTPSNIFEQCVGLGGRYNCVEIATVVFEGDDFRGFALKKRVEGDPAHPWHGLYHGTGATIRTNDSIADALTRASLETYPEPEHHINLTYVGTTLHDEPQRHATCESRIFVRKVHYNHLKTFLGEWKIFFTPLDAEIIDHHQQIYQQLFDWSVMFWDMKRDASGISFADVRKYPVRHGH